MDAVELGQGDLVALQHQPPELLLARRRPPGVREQELERGCEAAAGQDLLRHLFHPRPQPADLRPTPLVGVGRVDVAAEEPAGGTDVSLRPHRIVIDRLGQVGALEVFGHLSERPLGRGDAVHYRRLQIAIGNPGGRHLRRHRVETRLISCMVPGLAEPLESLPPGDDQPLLSGMLQPGPVRRSSRRHAVEPRGDVAPAFGARRVHLLEDVAQVLESRRNAVQIEEVLSGIDPRQMALELLEHHDPGESSPVAFGLDQLNAPQLVAGQIGEALLALDTEVVPLVVVPGNPEVGGQQGHGGDGLVDQVAAEAVDVGHSSSHPVTAGDDSHGGGVG